jgi:hypothetical protein
MIYKIKRKGNLVDITESYCTIEDTPLSYHQQEKLAIDSWVGFSEEDVDIFYVLESFITTDSAIYNSYIKFNRLKSITDILR